MPDATGEPPVASKTESLLKAQVGALELVARGAPLRDILTELALAIEAQSEGAVACIYLVDRGGKHLRIGAAPNLPESFAKAVDGLPIDTGLGTCAEAAALAKVVVTPDLAATKS